MDTKQTKVVRGIPTAPAVTKLCEAFPEIAPGDVVTYEQIERVLGLDRYSDRAKTVIQAWKAWLFDMSNVLLDNVPGVGYKHIVAGERIGYTSRKVKAGLRRVKHAGAVASTTPDDGLSSTERLARDHFTHATAALQQAFWNEKRALSQSMKALACGDSLGATK
jgi:hypothetical protein